MAAIVVVGDTNINALRGFIWDTFRLEFENYNLVSVDANHLDGLIIVPSDDHTAASLDRWVRENWQIERSNIQVVVLSQGAYDDLAVNGMPTSRLHAYFLADTRIFVFTAGGSFVEV